MSTRCERVAKAVCEMWKFAAVGTDSEREGERVVRAAEDEIKRTFRVRLLQQQQRKAEAADSSLSLHNFALFRLFSPVCVIRPYTF